MYNESRSHRGSRWAPAAEYDEPTQVISFPPSVEDRLSEARSLMRQDRSEDALATIQSAGAELARTNPELFVLAIVSQMGGKRITMEQTEISRQTTRTDRTAMGICYGQDISRKKTKNTVRRTFTIS